MTQKHFSKVSKLGKLAENIHSWAQELGFQQIGISDTHLESDEKHLQNWLDSGYEGEMGYMSRHGSKRSQPALLIPGTRRIISARMDYLPGPGAIEPLKVLDQPQDAYVSRYALGRDYHKVLRKRLGSLLSMIESYVETHEIDYSGSRLFTDSAPVLEKAIAQKSGLGWIGKNTLLINRKAGSWFFLGEIYTSLELPVTPVQSSNHCGSCKACLDICPTQAIVAPYQLDARRCISYLTIELKGCIPKELRPLIGNRIFGCDDCQLICPWNKYADFCAETDFQPRNRLDQSSLLDLLAWTEGEFLKRTEGSAIRRAGYTGWRRNIIVALGNSKRNPDVLRILQEEKLHCLSDLLSEHLAWAIQRQIDSD